jgi:hypothetical protein
LEALWQEESQIEIDASAEKNCDPMQKELTRCGFFAAAHPN